MTTDYFVKSILESEIYKELCDESSEKGVVKKKENYDAKLIIPKIRGLINSLFKKNE